MNVKAEMGVGTLIIFIALLLVAAVAAGVLIQTSGSLQQQALSTGAQATSQISTNIMVLEISAEDGTNAGVDELRMLVALAPGSAPLNLDSVTLSLATKNTSQTFTYDETASTTIFNVTYLQTGETSQVGRLVRGDVAEVLFFSQREIREDEDVRVTLIPQIGSSTQVVFTVPSVVTTQRVYLYP
ncbi:MAG: archaellin/type IV pilin N-terminal domain-containing protein [Candidatus Woesearchaeota archaeon]